MVEWYKKVNTFFDKFEDKIRGWLSHHPILYTFIAGVAIVLFWRGVWHTADTIPWLTGPVSMIIAIVILLAIGVFVSEFVGDMIIMSGIKKEKKVIDKTEDAVKEEMSRIDKIETTLEKIEESIDTIREEQDIHHGR